MSGGIVTKTYREREKKEKYESPTIDASDDASTAQKRAVEALKTAFKDSPGVIQSNPSDIKAVTYNCGILSLDRALGVGGLLGGRILDTYGKNGTGKTLLQMTIGGAIQRQGGVVSILDAEGSLSVAFAKACGLDTEHNFIYVRSTPEHIMSGEDFFEAIRIMISNGVHYIIVDSVPALVPSQKFSTQFGEGQQAVHARMMAEEVQKLNAYLTGSPRTIVSFINQIRGKPMTGPFQSNESQTGGEALKFYRSYAFEIQKNKDIVGKVALADGNIVERNIGVVVKLNIEKNKTAPKPTDFITFNLFTEFCTLSDGTKIVPGVDIYRDVFEVGTSMGVIEKNSSWYKFEDLRGLGDEEFIQGMRDKPKYVERIRQIVLSGGVIDDKLEVTTAT